MARQKRIRRPNLEAIREEYQGTAALAERVRKCLLDQLSDVIDGEGTITLGIPIESRVKSLSSIEEKIERRLISLSSVGELPDLVGLRIILLFQRDVELVENLILDHLDVIEKEDAGSKLELSQFGYQSRHFLVQVPPAWLTVPTYSDLGGITAEIQVRTLAQHIWAMVSHKLQYKREASVPLPLRRSISRASALLETVDLEFSRVLDERERYVREDLVDALPTDVLNVDSLAAALEKLLPKDNKYQTEAYDEVLSELKAESIETRNDLEAFLNKHLSYAISQDRKEAKGVVNDEDGFDEEELERARRGVYFSHSGLVRMALIQHRKLKK